MTQTKFVKSKLTKLDKVLKEIESLYDSTSRANVMAYKAIKNSRKQMKKLLEELN
jgi:hypothetical protein